MLMRTASFRLAHRFMGELEARGPEEQDLFKSNRSV